MKCEKYFHLCCTEFMLSQCRATDPVKKRRGGIILKGEL